MIPDLVLLRRVLVATCVVASTLLMAAPCQGVELGVDAGVCVQWPDSAGQSDFAFAAPGYQGGTGATLQTFRVGLALSETSQIELAPGVAVTSGDAIRRLTIGQYTMALSYLVGRIHGEGALPYLRAGGLASLKTMKDRYGYTSTTQCGPSLGAGVRWAKGDVFGIRGEIRVTRLFPAGRLFRRSDPGTWEVGLRGGVSVFAP